MVLGEGGSAGPVKAGEREWTTLGGYFDHVEQRGVAANICSYVGLTQVWRYVKGDALEPADDAQVGAMGELVAEAMREGAMGLSNSLLMPPSSLVTTEQLVTLAKVAGEHGGLYSTHIRDEGRGVFDAVAEAVRVGSEARIRVDIIHLKIADQALWGRMAEVVEMIDSARRAGLDIRANVYPYTAGQNNLRAIIPPWAHDGGNDSLLERLRSPAARARIKRDILDPDQDWYNHYLAVGSDWSRMLLVQLSGAANTSFVGRSMKDLIEARGGDPFDVLFDVLVEEGGQCPDGVLPPPGRRHAARAAQALCICGVGRRGDQSRRAVGQHPSASSLVRDIPPGSRPVRSRTGRPCPSGRLCAR